MASRLAVLCGLVLAVAGVAAQAEDSSNWYGALMGTYDKVDKHRCTDDATGATVAVGRRQNLWSYEFEGTYLPASYTCPGAVPSSTGTGKMKGTELALLHPVFADDSSWMGNFQGLFGIGALKRSNMPRLPGVTQNLFLDAGVAYLQGLKAFGQDFSVRAETRYRYQFEQFGKQFHTSTSFQDLIFNLGVQIPFLASTPAAAPAEPVQVIPAAEAPAPVPEPVPVAPAAVEAPPAPVEPPAPPVPPTIETAKAGDTIVLNGVNFDTGKATLTRNAKNILDGVAKDLNARPELKVEIGGHTDGRGKAAYNQKLSERRAQSVRAYLVKQGVEAERMTAVGYGLKQPIDSNETDDGRERNRRVELKVQ